MRSFRFGSPTFIFRDICKSDLLGVLENISNCGFEGVELFGMFGVKPKQIKNKCDELGLQVMCDHITYEEFVSRTDQVIEERAILGTTFITIDCIPADKIPGAENFSEAIDQIVRISQKCRDAGMTLLYHNQGFDIIERVNGTPILEVLLDTIPAEYLSFQPDIGWISLGGGNPAYYLDKYKDRCPIIHLKDYFTNRPIILQAASILGSQRGGTEYAGFEFRPTGYGVMNYATLVSRILACNPEWIVADHDLAYERNGFDDIQMSVDYIKNLLLVNQNTKFDLHA